MCKLEVPRGYWKFIPGDNTEKVKTASFLFLYQADFKNLRNEKKKVKMFVQSIHLKANLLKEYSQISFLLTSLSAIPYQLKKRQGAGCTLSIW